MAHLVIFVDLHDNAAPLPAASTTPRSLKKAIISARQRAASHYQRYHNEPHLLSKRVTAEGPLFKVSEKELFYHKKIFFLYYPTENLLKIIDVLCLSVS